MDQIKEMVQVGLDWFKKLDRKDPMVILLAGLLAFITLGSLGGAVLKTVHNYQEMKKPLIVLDAAYGGNQKGYEGIVSEAEVADKTVQALAKKLSENGYRVELTHPSGTFESLENKLKLIENQNPRLVISIHAAHSEDNKESGVRFFANPASEESKVVVKSLKNSFLKSTDKSWAGYLFYVSGEKNTSVPKYVEIDSGKEELETWSMMKNSSKNIVVAEQFFITNQEDVDRWNQEKGYQEIADRYLSALEETIKK